MIGRVAVAASVAVFGVAAAAWVATADDESVTTRPDATHHGGSSPTTETDAPTSATPTPVHPGSPADSPAPDDRVLLAPPPRSLSPVVAELVRTSPTTPAPDTYMFTAEQATWAEGPWLLIGVDAGGSGPWFGYTGPPDDVVMIGDATGRLGRSGGSELTTFSRGELDVAVVSRGLDPGATVDTARRLVTDSHLVTIPATALPSGLRPRPDLDPWGWTRAWSGAARARVRYEDPGGQISLEIEVHPAQRSDWPTVAAFYLDDMRYVIGHGASGIVGRDTSSDPASTTRGFWERGDRLYTVYATGMSVEQVAATLGDLVRPGDIGWNDRRWDDLAGRGRAGGGGAGP